MTTLLDSEQALLDRIRHSGQQGLTWKQLSEATGLGREETLSIIAILQRQKLIRTTGGKRDKCQVYEAGSADDKRDAYQQGFAVGYALGKDEADNAYERGKRDGLRQAKLANHNREIRVSVNHRNPV